jgi:hypothetical protein
MDKEHQTIYEKVSAPETRKHSVRKIRGLAPLAEQPAAVRKGHERFPSILESAEQERREVRRNQ